MIETVKWTITDGYLIAVHVAWVYVEQPHLGVLTRDGWVVSLSELPLVDPPDPDVNFPVADEGEARAILQRAGVDLASARRWERQ